MARVKKGDMVAVLSGKDKGKRGKVLQVWPREERALVERVNLVKHFERRTQQNPAGGVIEREHPMALSKLLPICSKCHTSTRPRWADAGDGKRQRLCRSCNEPLS